MNHELTERSIQCAIYVKWKSASRLLVPNYTPDSWFECDVFRVTDAKYFIEYEIKLTLVDFKRDTDKKRRGYEMVGRECRRLDERLKHERLTDGDPFGPFRFYYVMPDDMIRESDLPQWAGLIWAKRVSPEYVRLKFVRHSPRLHNAKVAADRVRRARDVCYYRMWSEITRAREESSAGYHHTD